MVKWKGTQRAPGLNPGSAGHTLSSLSPPIKWGSQRQTRKAVKSTHSASPRPGRRQGGRGQNTCERASSRGAPLATCEAAVGNSWKLGFYPFGLAKSCRKQLLETIPHRGTFNRAWLAASSSLANAHLRGTCPWGRAATLTHSWRLAPWSRPPPPPSPAPEAVPLAQGCLLQPGNAVKQDTRLLDGETLLPAGRGPAKASGGRTKCMSMSLSPKPCFKGFNLTSGLSGSQQPHAH